MAFVNSAFEESEENGTSLEMDGFSENGNETDMEEDGNKHGGNEEEDSCNAEEDVGIKGDGIKGDGMTEIS